jgi:L-alanine-DL-glutamate epimerase-like enolase superfamily enzyme
VTPARQGDGPLVECVASSAYRIPTDQPEADGTLEWDSTTVVAATVEGGGAVGTGWTYSAAGAVQVIDHELAAVVVGQSPCDVGRLHERMVRTVRNLGRSGIAATAISAVDIALWDLKARLLDLPLASLFGRYRASVPVYGSGGFTTYDDATTAGQLEEWVTTAGVSQVKIKIGEAWGSRTERDRQRVRLARRVIGTGVQLFVDANGAYSAHQAVRIGQGLVDESGIVWFEEPVSSDDLPGLRQVRRQLAVDVTAGEYGFEEVYFERMLSAEAVDCLQIDVTRCGGYTTWLRAAALAGARNTAVSAHCAPSLHAHVAGAVPNLRHVELFHDHTRVDAMLFDGVLQASGGTLTPDPDAPGHGMSLKVADADRYRVG